MALIPSPTNRNRIDRSSIVGFDLATVTHSTEGPVANDLARIVYDALIADGYADQDDRFCARILTRSRTTDQGLPVKHVVTITRIA